MFCNKSSCIRSEILPEKEIKSNPKAIQYIKDPSKEICWLTLKADHRIIKLPLRKRL